MFCKLAFSGSGSFPTVSKGSRIRRADLCLSQDHSFSSPETLQQGQSETVEELERLESLSSVPQEYGWGMVWEQVCFLLLSSTQQPPSPLFREKHFLGVKWVITADLGSRTQKVEQENLYFFTLGCG